MKTNRSKCATLCAILAVWLVGAALLGRFAPHAQAQFTGQKDIGVHLQPDKPDDSDKAEQLEVAFTKDTLRGLEGVWVVVTRRESRAEKYGLTLRTLKSQIEAQLQQHDIGVLSQSQYTHSSNGGILCIDILPLISEEMGFSAVSINIALMQNVMLTGENAEKMCQATTWERRTVALCDLESIKEIPQNVAGFVDHFIKDFISANAVTKTPEPATDPNTPKPQDAESVEPKGPPKSMLI